MAAPPPDPYRLRLEGRAELLEAARRRYQELLDGLRAPRWEERLRERLATLREAGASQGQVDAALAMALRRAGAEGWPGSAPTVRLLHEVQALRDIFLRTVKERLGPRGAPRGEDCASLMGALEDQVRCAPRTVPPGQRHAVALEVLPEDLPALRDAEAFGALLRPLFREPFSPAGPVPLRPEDVEALRQRWMDGELALSLCWTRLTYVDSSEGVVREVRRLASREPLHAPRSAPERLAQADYWYTMASGRLYGLIRERLGLLSTTGGEWLELSLWLCERGGSLPEARLRASAFMGEARAGLFELAYELWEALHAGRPEAECWPERRWERMLEAARRAAPESSRAETAGIRDALRTFILARSLGTSLLRGWREPLLLEELVLQAREVAREE